MCIMCVLHGVLARHLRHLLHEMCAYDYLQSSDCSPHLPIFSKGLYYVEIFEGIVPSAMSHILWVPRPTLSLSAARLQHLGPQGHTLLLGRILDGGSHGCIIVPLPAAAL